MPEGLSCDNLNRLTATAATAGVSLATDVDYRPGLLFYDGRNPVWEEITDEATQAVSARTCLWGPDISGTMQGAGGVGGLPALDTGAAALCCAYDGNGNVAALVDDAEGSVATRYEYSPFPS